MGLYLGSAPVTLGAGPLRLRQSSGNVSVAAGGTSHTKGAWIEIIASTSADSTLLILAVAVAQTGQNSATLIDLAVGAASSEVAFLENLPCGSASTGGGWQVPLPVAIPAGSRISARTQSATASRVALVGVSVLSGGAQIPGALTVLGADTGTSRGVSLNHSAAWAEITASTSEDYRSLILVPSAGASSLQANDGDVSLGVGAAGFEDERLALGVATNTAEALTVGNGDPSWSVSAIQRGAPAGSRLAARITGFTLTGIDAAVIGVS